MSRATLAGCAPAALGAFDFGLLALAGPRIAPAVGATGDAYPWLFSASSFAYGAAVLPAAVAVRRAGPRRTLAAGLIATAAGAALLAAAHGLPIALAARVVLGLGGALAAPAALALLGGIEDDGARRSAFAALGAAVAVGFAVGTLLAGIGPWRLVLGGVALASAAVSAAAVGVGGDAAGARGGDAGLRGGARLSAAIVLVAAGFAGAARVWAMAAFAVAGALAATVPRRQGAPVAVCVAGAATTAGGVGATVLVGSALADARLPGALLAVFGLAAVPGSRLARRAEPAVAAVLGLAVQASGLVVVAAALASGPQVALLVPAVAVFGVGHVAANAGVAGAAGARSVSAAALLVSAQYLGGGIGPVLATGVAGRHGIPAGVLAAALVTAVGAVALAIGRSPDRAWAGRAEPALIESPDIPSAERRWTAR